MRSNHKMNVVVGIIARFVKEKCAFYSVFCLTLVKKCIFQEFNQSVTIKKP